jgi:sterol desaturase/sphingolipid hydroxylase (fatty acid hydroxylase superfamily)
MQVLDLTIILLILLYASLSVYISHRYHQHRVIGGLAFLHKFHTVEHHALFNEIKMIQEQRKDLYMILFPPSIAAFLILIFYPFIGYLMSLLFYSRVAWLYYLVACSYYLVYEFVHFVCHQPENSFLRKLPVLKYLAAHHQKHHNRRLMGQANFGIVTTFWDYMFKTKV